MRARPPIFNLGNSLARAGDPDGARAAYQRAVDSGHPDEAPEAAYRLGVLLEGVPDLAAARTAFRSAVDSGQATWASPSQERLDALDTPATVDTAAREDPTPAPAPAPSPPTPEVGPAATSQFSIGLTAPHHRAQVPASYAQELSEKTKRPALDALAARYGGDWAEKIQALITLEGPGITYVIDGVALREENFVVMSNVVQEEFLRHWHRALESTPPPA